MTTATTATAPKQVAINDIGSAEDFLAAVEKTLKFFNDGDLIEGTVVKIDRDEVLLDVGYKTEGVIPSRELSIKHDVDPNEVVNVGDTVEALVLQKEDKEGRLILSKKRAQYERAWGDVEKIKEADGVVTGSVIEVVKGGLIVDIGLRGFLPASLIELRRVRDLTPYLGQEIEAKILELDKNRNNVVLSRRALLEQTQSESPHHVPQQPAQGPGPQGRRLVDRQLRCVRRPRRRRRSRPRLRALAGSTSSTPARSSRSARRSPSRSSRSTSTASASRCRSRRRRRTRGRSSPAPTRSVRSLPARSRSSCRSVRSSASRTASRASCTSPSCPASTSSSPSRSCRSAKRSSSRSSTSTSSVAASRSRSSRRTRASTPRAPSSTRRSTACSPSTTSRGTTSTPRASTRRPTSGARASTTQREKWEQEYAAAQARWEAHKAQILKRPTDETPSPQAPALVLERADAAGTPRRRRVARRAARAALEPLSSQRLTFRRAVPPPGEPPFGVPGVTRMRMRAPARP